MLTLFPFSPVGLEIISTAEDTKIALPIVSCNAIVSFILLFYQGFYPFSPRAKGTLAPKDAFVVAKLPLAKRVGAAQQPRERCNSSLS